MCAEEMYALLNGGRLLAELKQHIFPYLRAAVFCEL